MSESAIAPHKATPQTWHTLPSEEVARQLQVDPGRGLTSSEAKQRQATYGPNVLAAKKKEPGWQAFLRQYKDFMQIVLIAAAVINQVFTGELGTTLMLVLLTVFNAVMGLNQESKAEASLAALEIDASELVPGDIVLMEAGNRVPADGRLFVTATFEIEEAALTGESVASSKDTEAITIPDVPLGDRHSLQKQLDRLTMIIAGLAGVAFLLMLAIGLSQGKDFDSLFIAGVALAISAIPTGMPAVVTSLYSLGTRSLAAQNAIVKRLPSVETLGSVSAICSDKTGTLTLNKMTAREFVVPGQNRYKVTGEGYSTKGELLHSGGAKLDLDPILLPMALCADARLDGETLIGDPTEGALIVLSAKGGIDVDGAREMYPRVAEIPFDSDYKLMGTFHKMKDEQGKEVVRCFVKGAPDVLIPRTASFWVPGGENAPASEETRRLALAGNERMAEAGERVMVVARKDFDPATFDPKSELLDRVKDLTFLAMVGIVDPPRAEAKDAIARCHSAGIQVRMITGDHAVTAAAIGKELGITGTALTGAEFAKMSDDELLQKLPEIGVIARVAPEDKIRLVSLLQRQQNIVAMTGDGVNDAPALKKADIGVAMGITGTEVSKESAVMILTDDNFATIVKAVEHGRAIYDNLAKYIRFQMTALPAFILSYLGAAYWGVLGGVPFTTLAVLWINFLVQVPIATSLGFDKPLPGLMEHKPRPLTQPVLSLGQWAQVFFVGLLMALATLWVEGEFTPAGTAVAATMGFVLFSLFNLVIGLSSRSVTGTVLTRDTFGDRRQLALFGLSFALTFLPTELPFMQRALGLTTLSGDQWRLCFGLAICLLLVIEVIKFFLRRRSQPAARAAWAAAPAQA